MKPIIRKRGEMWFAFHSRQSKSPFAAGRLCSVIRSAHKHDRAAALARKARQSGSVNVSMQCNHLVVSVLHRWPGKFRLVNPDVGGHKVLCYVG